MAATPKSLRDAIIFFADYEHCRKAVEAIRWPDGKVTCPTCGSDNVGYLETQKRYKCYQKDENGKRHAGQFSLKVGTIFEDSPIGLEKWLPALWLVTNCKNGVSSYELARALDVTQKTAWFMLSRLRLVMQGDAGGKLSGEIEIDETYIGGKARNMHKGRRERITKHGSKSKGKIAVMGLLERRHGASQVRLNVLPATARRSVLDPLVRANVQSGSTIHTDALPSYNSLHGEYVHNVIDHAEKYVNGQVHTNGLENFWSLFKRTIAGTYVSVEPFHLFRYLDEQAYRFNNRKLNDAQRFAIALKSVIGRRLTYAALTGAELPERC